MNNAKLLYELQNVDLEIERKSQNLTQIDGELGKNDEVIAARDALENVRKVLIDLEHQQHTIEWSVSDLGAKIGQDEKKLYEGSLKNPKELMNLQKEVELLKEQRSIQEDELLNMMIEVDAAQQDAKQKGANLIVMEKEWQDNQKALQEERAKLEFDLDVLRQKRQVIASQIDAAIIRIYEGQRTAKQGLAVAKVVQGRCQGCRISLPMSDQQKARLGHELVTCSNCGRILYMD